MKVRILTTLVVLAVLVSSITACTARESYLIQLLKLTPEEADSVGYINYKKCVDDPDFNFMCPDFTYDDMTYYLDWVCAYIETTDVSAYGTIEIDHYYLFVFWGNFNLGNIRDVLVEEDFSTYEYKDVEVWYHSVDYTAFIDNMIISGAKNMVEACIRSYKKEYSMYDNKDLKAVVDRLPDDGVCYTVGGYYGTYCLDAIASGICIRSLISGDGLLNITGCYKFDSSVSARTAMTEGAEDDLKEYYNTTSIDVRLRNQFIEFTGDMEVPAY